MTNILDKEHFNYDFYGCLEAKYYKQLKWIIVFILKVEILKMAPKMAVSLSPKTYLTNILNKNHFNFDFYGCKRL